MSVVDTEYSIPVFELITGFYKNVHYKKVLLNFYSLAVTTRNFINGIKRCF